MSADSSTQIGARVFHACLADLEARIDPRQEQANLEAWQIFLDGRCRTEYFVPPARTAAPTKVPWPQISVNFAQCDIDAMVLHQLSAVSGALAQGAGQRLGVRCNYGTAILPSLFGCEMFMMEESLNVLPTCRPLGAAAIPRLIEAGVPDIQGGLCGKVFAAARRFQDVFRQYPRIGAWVDLYHPDVQGPLDVVELVWGSTMFLAFCDDPGLMHEMLDLVTRTYAAFMRAWLELMPPRRGEYFTHWSMMHKAPVMLRDDSLMNLSPRMYEEYVRPCDQRLFDEFGGGAIHFCGRADHYIQPMSRMSGLTAVNLSQPHLNDMETIYRHTVDKGIKLLGLSRDWADRAVGSGRSLRGQAQC